MSKRRETRNEATVIKRAYLDWNATTPPHPEVLAAMAAAAADGWGNPASLHADGRAARRYVEDARKAVAELLGADPRDVILTGSGTEANNLALASLAAAAKPGSTLVTSVLEHPSVLASARRVAALHALKLELLPIEPSGTVSTETLYKLSKEQTIGGICVQAVNHETGILQPLERVLEIAREANCRVLCDTVQAVGRLPDLWLEADYRAVAAHKIRGPKGIGALVTRPGAPMARVLEGGAQERGLRPGTQDGMLAAGFSAAGTRALDGPSRYARLAVLRDHLEAGLRRVAQGLVIVGETSLRAPHVSSVLVPRWASPEVVAALDLEGVSVSGGSACSAGTVSLSPVIAAIVGEEQARGAVRFSLGEETTEAEIDFAIFAFERVVSRV